MSPIAAAESLAVRLPAACLPGPQPLAQARQRSSAAQDWLTRLLVHEARAAGGASHRELMEALPDGAFVARQGRFVYANPALLRLLGYTSAQFLGLPVAAVVAPDSLQAWNSLCEPGRADHAPQASIRLMTCDGVLVAVEVRVGALPHVGVLGTVRAVHRDALVHHERELASLVYQASSEAMMVTDHQARIVSVNPAFMRITGYAAEEIVGQDASVLNSTRHAPGFYEALRRTLEESGSWQGEVWHRRRNGESFAGWLAVSTRYDAHGAVQNRVALFADLTSQKQNEALIWRQANYDQLTQLPNRSMLRDRLAQELKKAHRCHDQVAVLSVDLDRFAEVNERHGHAAGDRVLVLAAQRIGALVRETDTVARMGGNEFAVVSHGQDCAEQASTLAQQLVQQLEMDFDIGGQSIALRASVGIALYPGDGGDMEHLLRNAGQALHNAKAHGGAQYRFFTPALQQAAHRRSRMADELRTALAQGQFQLHYQPIVDLASGRVRKAEALLRWNHPTLGLVSPAEFIPVAEETRLILEMGDWVFREAARTAQMLRKHYDPDFQISLNKSPVQFEHGGTYPEQWLAYLAELGLAGDALVLEITEGLLMDSSMNTAQLLRRYRERGIQVAIDDFGTGYSALAYLRKFDIDYLKIDREFVSQLTPASHDLALTEAIVVMAHKLGLSVVAEGVETPAQRALLREVGCDYAQGFLFDQAQPLEVFEYRLQLQLAEGVASAWAGMAG